MGKSNVALTINSITSINTNNEIVIGVKGDANFNHLYAPNATAQSEYWIVVFDRQTLKVVENFMFSDNSSVPSQLTPYLKDTNYFYVLTTQLMSTNNLPIGAFYDWLRAEGAGKELSRIEQAAGALNCGSWSLLSYTYVDVFGPKDTSSFEFSNLVDKQLITTLELMPLDIGGTTYYAPVQIS